MSNKINGKNYRINCSYLKSLSTTFRDSKPFEVSRRSNDRREGKVACSRIISSQREEITPRCFLVTRKRATCHEPRESPASYPRRFAAAADLAPALFVPLARRQLKINPPRSSSLFFLLRLRFVLPPFFQLVLKHRAYNTRNRLPFPAKQYSQRGKKCSVKLATKCKVEK